MKTYIRQLHFGHHSRSQSVVIWTKHLNYDHNMTWKSFTSCGYIRISYTRTHKHVFGKFSSSRKYLWFCERRTFYKNDFKHSNWEFKCRSTNSMRKSWQIRTSETSWERRRELFSQLNFLYNTGKNILCTSILSSCINRICLYFNSVRWVFLKDKTFLHRT